MYTISKHQPTTNRTVDGFSAPHRTAIKVPNRYGHAATKKMSAAPIRKARNPPPPPPPPPLDPRQDVPAENAPTPTPTPRVEIPPLTPKAPPPTPSRMEGKYGCTERFVAKRDGVFGKADCAAPGILRQPRLQCAVACQSPTCVDTSELGVASGAPRSMTAQAITRSARPARSAAVAV
jgi:hypothetical protein